ncbi:MAG: hypothetical protein RR365_01100 [Bacteroides sp.]
MKNTSEYGLAYMLEKAEQYTNTTLLLVYAKSGNPHILRVMSDETERENLKATALLAMVELVSAYDGLDVWDGFKLINDNRRVIYQAVRRAIRAERVEQADKHICIDVWTEQGNDIIDVTQDVAEIVKGNADSILSACCDGLSKTQMTVLKYMALGWSASQIATHTHRKVETVWGHIRDIRNNTHFKGAFYDYLNG